MGSTWHSFKVSFKVTTVTPTVSSKDKHCPIAKQSHWLSSWFWDRQKFGKKNHSIPCLTCYWFQLLLDMVHQWVNFITTYNIHWNNKGDSWEQSFLSALSLTLHPPPITNSEAGESSVCRRIGRQQNWLWQATCAVLTQVIGKPHRSRTRTLSALGQVSWGSWILGARASEGSCKHKTHGIPDALGVTV